MRCHPVGRTPSASSLHAARSVLASMNPYVRPRQWVAALTVGFSRIAGLVGAAVKNGVLSRGDGAEMCRIHTGRNTANMVNEVSLGDRPNEVFVGPAMCSQAPIDALLSPPVAEGPVAIFIPTGRPEPASAGLLNVAEESFFGGNLNNGHSKPPSTSYHK